MRSQVAVRKYHGLGNDFLVLLNVGANRGLSGPALTIETGADLARAICDRHRGVGADGLLVVSAAPADGTAVVTMRLHNADGSIAEMSGNGIRCFSQGVIDAELAPIGILRVQTDAGLRVVSVGATDADGVANIAVEMGVAKIDSFVIPAPVHALVQALGDPYVHVAAVDVGNPHLVVAVDPLRVDIASFPIASFGASVEEHFMDAFGGINVHVVAPAASVDGALVDTLDMTIWERGVGITQACGTGATAVAVAAFGWGLVGPVCDVRQPGGVARVEIDGERLMLIGPSQFVAACDFAWIR